MPASKSSGPIPMKFAPFQTDGKGNLVHGMETVAQDGDVVRPGRQIRNCKFA
jgi:hypothetical protein